MTQIYGKGWNVDTLAAHITKHGAEADKDNEGQIILYTDLYEHGDGTLHDHPETS